MYHLINILLKKPYRFFSSSLNSRFKDCLEYFLKKLALPILLNVGFRNPSYI
jgi:hypothetical protein